MAPFNEYVVDSKELDFWFHKINDEIFEGVVPYPHVIGVCTDRNKWGYVKMVEVNGTEVMGLFMKTSYPTFGAFLQILSHEMVHIWQMLVNGDTGNHNKHFYSWKVKFEEHNLTLRRNY